MIGIDRDLCIPLLYVSAIAHLVSSSGVRCNESDNCLFSWNADWPIVIWVVRVPFPIVLTCRPCKAICTLECLGLLSCIGHFANWGNVVEPIYQRET